MPIYDIAVANFKGVANHRIFEIKPITVIIGPNSSGKSSVIHAIAALAQTIKLGNSASVLTLDDEFAQVHLGRFVEIAHSRDYKEAIELGINLGKQAIRADLTSKGENSTVSGECVARYKFKSFLRTQEIYVESANLSVGSETLQIGRGAKAPYGYWLEGTSKKRLPVSPRGNFFFRVDMSTANLSAKKKPSNAELKEWFRNYFILEEVQQLIDVELRRTLYLGPFRQSPLRRYPYRGATAIEVGAQGEAAITMLASEHTRSKVRPHLSQINHWLSELNLAKAIAVARVGTSDLFDVSLTLKDGKRLPIADLGYGLSQVLPVLTQCSFAPESSTLLFEQPELHLHEGAARKLSKVFTDTVKSKKCHVVIETHSKELVWDFIKQIRDGFLSLDDFLLYSVNRDGSASEYTRVPMYAEDGAVEVDHPWFKGVEG